MNPEHNNVAAAEYVDLEGNVQYIVRESVEGGKIHSEKVILDELTEMGIPKENVKRIYSELEPCELGGAKCKEKICEMAPDAEVTFTWDYPGKSTGNLSPLRNFGTNQRRKAIQSLIK